MTEDKVYSDDSNADEWDKKAVYDEHIKALVHALRDACMRHDMPMLCLVQHRETEESSRNSRSYVMGGMNVSDAILAAVGAYEDGHKGIFTPEYSAHLAIQKQVLRLGPKPHEEMPMLQ